MDSSKVRSMLTFVKLCFRKQNFLEENLTRTVVCIEKFYLYLFIYLYILYFIPNGCQVTWYYKKFPKQYIIELTWIIR